MNYWNNKCIYYENDGFCLKCQCNCPKIVRQSEDNENNLPCDFTSYTESDNQSLII